MGVPPVRVDVMMSITGLTFDQRGSIESRPILMEYR
jgi:hypothetical protein